MQTKNFTLTMRDGTEIFVNRWTPDSEEEVKGIIQLHHGLAEHSMRYDRFGSVLAENGYVLNAYDMRGHGKTGENAEQKGTGLFGKLADKDGFNVAIEDLHEVFDDLKKAYPGKKSFLFGHSFGSFISQGFIEKYGSEIDGCILCGTAGPRQPLMIAGHLLAVIIKAFKGADATSPFLKKLSFGSYCKRIENPETPDDWIAANADTRKTYEMDNWCGFPLKVAFYCDMTSGLKQIHTGKNMKKIPLDLPIFFIYGGQDPVGDYGKTVKNLFNIYKKNGIKNLDIKEYPNDRHELLGEDDKEIVEKDVLNWLAKI